MVDNLKAVLVRQKETLDSLEKEIRNIEANDLVTENQKLKDELLRQKASLDNEKSNNVKLSEENSKLRGALYEQFYNEKTYILNSVSKRMDIYYKGNIKEEINRLQSFELSVKKRIDNMIAVLKANRVSVEDDIYIRIEELRKQLNIKVTLAREEIEKHTGAFCENRNEELSKLKQEQVTEEEIRSRIKQNNIESLIGLNIINKLGILLLVIGVIAASQFTYYHLPDMLKSVFAFLIGAVMLVAGELLNRRKPNVFSLGITSGGIAVLYASLALSYFRFEILGMYPALGLCVLITLGAFVLSQRYNSQTISAFAMVGGYLPIFSIAGDKTMLYGAMVYFVILNFLALIVAVNKKWTVTAYIGFVLNVIGSIYISTNMFNTQSDGAALILGDIITILYLVFAFVIYTLIPVVGSFRKKVGFKNSDTVLLALNTFISSLLLYWAFYEAGLEDLKGLLALVFAGVYIMLGWFIDKYMTKEKTTIALFYITGLTFVVLVIPFQFGRMWLSLGWLVEGIALLSYGIYKEIKSFKRAGTVISFLCLGAFILFDVLAYHDELFTLRYLSITLGSIIVLGTLIYKKNLSEIQVRLFKYFTVINVWIFTLYLIGGELSGYLLKLLEDSSYNHDYLVFAAMIIASFLAAFIIPRIRILLDNVMKGISVTIYVLALTVLFFVNFESPVNGYLSEVPTAVSVVGTIELAFVAILSILALRDLILCLVMERKFGIEWYPFIISLYFVVILTQNLITQYNLEFNNAVISIIYLVTALAWITFGFVKRYVFIRRFGLGLSMLAVVKLFIIDLAFLEEGYRIVSYFVFGLTLLAISFVYQYFNKRIESISEVMPDEKKTDN
ncbi:MAG: DUF2339 domain-containing protein [Clostridiaceae bacterium]|nr:DUF2339 domain-containing protein [Clostridiaceae bacterium]